MKWVKQALTRTVAVKGLWGKTRYVSCPPDPILVYGVYFAIAGVIVLAALQIVHVIVLRQWNSEIFAAMTGLIGTIIGVFFGNKA